MEWIKVSDQLPESNKPVIGFSEEWIDEDFNPEGIRECFLQDHSLVEENKEWISAKWWNHQDTYVNDDETAPTHFMHYPNRPRNK